MMRYAFLATLICMHVAHAQELTASEPKTNGPVGNGVVYVLLEKQQVKEGLLWTITSEHGFVIADLMNERRSDTLATTTLTLEVSGGKLVINGRKCPRNVSIKPCQGDLSVDIHAYAGSLHIVYKNDTWHLVNGVNLEDYVCSVLGSESWPGWPLEVNKALAIVLRSYVIAKRIEARGKRKFGQDFIYDVLNTNMHQTYHGLHKHKILRQAVDETRGIVLAYNNKPILAMYDACCGGVIPAHIAGVNFSGAPYLARPYACTFCTKSCSYAWNALYSFADIIAAVKAHDQHVASIQRLYVSKTDKAGLVQEITIHAGKKRIKLSGKKTYSALSKIKSYAFSIKKHHDGYTFEGKGYGHHLGLCQWGARKMIELGWLWTDILKFYYPEVEFMLIKWK